MTSKIGQFPTQRFSAITIPDNKLSSPITTWFDQDAIEPVFLQFNNLNGIDVYLNDDTLYNGPFEITKNQSLRFKFNFTSTVLPGEYRVELLDITNNESVTNFIFFVKG
jgi:hypothetical protein